jgi:hypothetical protein
MHEADTPVASETGSTRRVDIKRNTCRSLNSDTVDGMANSGSEIAAIRKKNKKHYEW